MVVGSDALRQVSRELRTGSFELPPFPAVAASVLKLVQEPTVDTKRLTALVERDPALAATVLRVVRSPAFAGVRPVSSLDQAIARLGIRPLTEIVVASCVSAQMLAGSSSPLLAPTWCHAVATATFTRHIGAIKRRYVESAYLCGLFHNVGRLILLQKGAELDTVERHHAKIAVAAAEHWMLPEPVIATIRCQGRYDRAGASAPAAAVTALAARLAREIFPEDGAAPLPALEEDPVLGVLALAPVDTETLRSRGELVLDDVRVLGRIGS